MHLLVIDDIFVVKVDILGIQLVLYGLVKRVRRLWKESSRHSGKNLKYLG
jgi:hypothetical protein